MSPGGCDQPKPYLSTQNKGKRVMKRKRPWYVLKVNITPPPNAPIAHVPSSSPNPAHTSPILFISNLYNLFMLYHCLKYIHSFSPHVKLLG